MKRLYEDLPPVEIAGRKLVGRVLFGLLFLIAALVGATAGLMLVYTTDLPQVDALEAYRPSSVTELYDDHSRVIGSFALQRRVVATYEDFPPVLRDALVSIEDKDFYRHSGINVWRIVGAAYRDIESGGRLQGASTLTMQLARNLFLSADRSFHRKVQETMLAIQIERRFTKPQIFTLYANQIFLAHGVYGFEAASEYYFGKPARSLSLTEAALLAGLPKGPGIYSPINHPERAQKRRNLVINAMLEDGKITAAQAADARSAPVALHLQRDPNSLAPYFVEEIRRYLGPSTVPIRFTKADCASTLRSTRTCRKPRTSPCSTAWRLTSTVTAGRDNWKMLLPRELSPTAISMPIGIASLR